MAVYQPQSAELGGDRVPVDVIEPPRRWGFPNLREVWQQRELVLLLARRDITVRYNQAVVGTAWVVIQPLIYATIFSLVRTFLRASNGGAVPYPVFILAGITLWMLFNHCVSRCTTSLISGSNLLKQLSFPRLALPAASSLSPLVDFAVGFVVLLVIMAVFGVFPTLNILLAPVFVLLMLALAFGVGIWAAAVAVRYRDVQQIIPLMLQVLIYTSPIIYGLTKVPDSAAIILHLNPLSGALEGFRWAVLPHMPAPGYDVITTAVVAAVLIVTGLVYFNRAEREFADVV